MSASLCLLFFPYVMDDFRDHSKQPGATPLNRP
jgi:hypothetical protein